MTKTADPAVGMNSLRSGLDHRRMCAAPAKTSERTTIDKPMASTLPGMLISPA
jgi:hypothetical protein